MHSFLFSLALVLLFDGDEDVESKVGKSRGRADRVLVGRERGWRGSVSLFSGSRDVVGIVDISGASNNRVRSSAASNILVGNCAEVEEAGIKVGVDEGIDDERSIFAQKSFN